MSKTFSRFSTFVNIFQHFSTFFNIFEHFSTFFNILKHFSTFFTDPPKNPGFLQKKIRIFSNKKSENSPLPRGSENSLRLLFEKWGIWPKPRVKNFLVVFFGGGALKITVKNFVSGKRVFFLYNPVLKTEKKYDSGQKTFQKQSGFSPIKNPENSHCPGAVRIPY